MAPMRTAVELYENHGYGDRSDSRKRHREQFIAYWGETPLADIDRAEVEILLRHHFCALRAGRYEPRVKWSTIAACAGSLQSVLGHAVARGLIAERSEFPKFRPEPPRDRLLSR